MKRLAIVATHPVQYNAPWFALLQKRGRVQPKVFYTWSQTKQGPKYDPTFQKVIEWDIPLLEGYEYSFVPNVAKDPGSHHFRGVDNPGLIAAIEAWQPDAVLVIGWSYKSHLRCLRHFKGRVPVLFRGDSTLLDEAPGLKTTLRRLALRWVYRHIDKALYVGKQNRQYFLVHGVPQSRLVAAPHAIDNQRFGSLTAGQEQTREELSAQCNLGPGCFTVLFAGKFESKKDPFFLLSLARELPHPGYRFVLAGNGPLEAELKEAAKGDPRVRFLPFQNQTAMPALYAVASVFVLPSRGPGETWGLAANEAMAAGLPVLMSSKAGGAVDLVGENGLIFQPGDVTNVATYLEKLRQEPASLAAAGQVSKERIKRFSFAELAAGVEEACGL